MLFLETGFQIESLYLTMEGEMVVISTAGRKPSGRA